MSICPGWEGAVWHRCCVFNPGRATRKERGLRSSETAREDRRGSCQKARLCDDVCEFSAGDTMVRFATSFLAVLFLISISNAQQADWKAQATLELWAHGVPGGAA